MVNGIIKMQDNPWKLYSTLRGFNMANDILNDVWEFAQKLPWKDAESLMLKVMHNLRKFGANDTEPRSILVHRLRKRFGENDYVDKWRL